MQQMAAVDTNGVFKAISYFLFADQDNPAAVSALMHLSSPKEKPPSNGKGIGEAASSYGQGWKSWKAGGVSFGY